VPPALSTEQLQQFATDGFVVVPGVVDESHLIAADGEIDRLIETEPPPATATGKHFWFLRPSRLPAADAALRASPALALAEQLTAPAPLDLGLHHIQVALNIPPQPLRPGGPHIDGHVKQHPDQTTPNSFTLLAGIFLSDESEIEQGNLWVWPGSHLVHEALFRQRGADVLMSTDGHITMLEDAPPLGDPVAVRGRRGDVLLAHFLLGHNTGSNLGGTTRRILYYRLCCPDHRRRWAETFTDAFTEYPRVRPFR
jgi:hypothetical protein